MHAYPRALEPECGFSWVWLLPPSPEAIIQGVPRIEQPRCLFEMASHSHPWRIQTFQRRAAAWNSQTPLHGRGRELAASKHPGVRKLTSNMARPWPQAGQGPEAADASGPRFLLLPPSDCGKPSVAHRHTGKPQQWNPLCPGCGLCKNTHGGFHPFLGGDCVYYTIW